MTRLPRRWKTVLTGIGATPSPLPGQQVATPPRCRQAATPPPGQLVASGAVGIPYFLFVLFVNCVWKEPIVLALEQYKLNRGNNIIVNWTFEVLNYESFYS